jgi:hypothetical protein
VLSKSQIMRGLQCDKSLWLLKNKPELRELADKVEGRFEQGLSVGDLAQNLFPNGQLVSFNANNLKSMALETQELIESGSTTIYEATFIANGVFASIDILHKDETGWHIYEVKASTKVKGINVVDATSQYLTVNDSLRIKSVNIIHVNNQYVFDNTLNINDLFVVKDITEQVYETCTDLPDKIKHLQKIVKLKKEPSIDIGAYCSNPYPCDFAKYCKKHLPKASVFNLYRMNTKKKHQHYYNGVISYQQAKEHLKLNKTQKLQVNSHLNNEVIIDRQIIQNFIDEINYPISYFDFETFNEAIPRFNGQRPYQQMPFQYSLHIESAEGEVEHKEFLADENNDSRLPLVEAMLNDLPKQGSIMAFNQSFEITRIKELALAFPAHKESLESLIPRFVDLIVPFRKLGYYHPNFHGSFSIKSVLPAMFHNEPDLDYKQLDIKNGGMAMDTFANLPRLKDKAKREAIRASLLAYCKLDTWAMVKIYNKLLALV